MKITISDIQVGERRREDLGDIKALADSINSWGLLHPIVIDDKNRLVAGERRLRACQQLGWKEIEVKQLANLTTDELREIELEENLKRKDLTPLELSKNMLELAKLKAEKSKTCLKTNFAPPSGFSAESAKNLGGRPVKPDSKEAIAKELGIPRTTLREAEQHVAAVEQFPELAALPKTNAIDIAKKLRDMPEPVREEKLQHMREVQAAGDKEERRIDEVYKVKKRYLDALSTFPTLDVDDSLLAMWTEDMNRDDIERQLDRIQTSKAKLDQLEHHLKTLLRGPRLIKEVR
jgi:ParB family chromosome partitioning protein